jgi:hypothetical protein
MGHFVDISLNCSYYEQLGPQMDGIGDSPLIFSGVLSYIALQHKRKYTYHALQTLRNSALNDGAVC